MTYKFLGGPADGQILELPDDTPDTHRFSELLESAKDRDDQPVVVITHVYWKSYVPRGVFVYKGCYQ